MEVAKIFAERVKARLVELDWNHEDLAGKVGWKRASVTQYLQGKTVPRADLLVRWASVLGVSADWLLGTEDKPSEDELRFSCITAVLEIEAGHLPAVRDFLQEKSRDDR